MTSIVLDTSVVSEFAKPSPSAAVTSWAAGQRFQNLYLSSVAVGEIAAGIERLPAGRRRADRERWLAELLRIQFAGRVLSFDARAALAYGKLVAASFRQGRPPDVADAQIAAVAMVHGMTVATRDIGGFEPFGVPLVNPWE
jgi:toxin FitB